jgi:urease accessory protein
MKKISIAALTAVALAALAFAHAGFGHPWFVNGLRHPVCGPDHVLAMMGVGVWSALAMPANRVLFAPIAFAAAILAGATAGIDGVPFAGVEAGMAISVVAMGLMILAGVKLPATVAALLIGAFGIMHGYTHGAEVDGAILAYVIGFMLIGVAMHLAGVSIDRGVVKSRAVTSVTGCATAAAGISLLVA